MSEVEPSGTVMSGVEQGDKVTPMVRSCPVEQGGWGMALARSGAPSANTAFLTHLIWLSLGLSSPLVSSQHLHM